MDKKIFKAYDIRGLYPQEINELDTYKIAQSYCKFLNPKEVVVGCDVRTSSPSLKRAAIKGITDLGIKVIDIGTISTDMLYFAVANYGYSGGFSITASHNPKEYNGIKMVREESRPISSDTGIFEIRDIALEMEKSNKDIEGDPKKELVEEKNVIFDYIQKVKSFADFSKIKPMKIAVNANFGLAGEVAERILEGTGIKIEKLNFEPNGNFPKGRPDPLVPENREELSRLVIKSKSDIGVAWDGDADRCFFFTEKGEFIEGYFITALLAKNFLKKNKGAKIIRDTRLTWAIDDIVSETGGKVVPSKAGHSFIKEKMRTEDAVFGGEMSAHYYFKDYFYADNGMIPFVMMLEFLSNQGKNLSEIMKEIFWNKYFVSGEINNEVKSTEEVIKKAKQVYSSDALSVDETDGVSIEHENWRFNLRASNTEPLVRLNVEAKSKEEMEKRRDELLEIIKS